MHKKVKIDEICRYDVLKPSRRNEIIKVYLISFNKCVIKTRHLSHLMCYCLRHKYAETGYSFDC